MQTVIFYHNDTDGWASAWCMHKYVTMKLDEPEPVMIQVAYDKEPDIPLWMIKGKRVMVLDYCFNEDTMYWLVNESSEFYWFDHHKSNEDFSQDLLDYSNSEKCPNKNVTMVFNTGQAGCMLCYAWLPLSLLRDKFPYAQQVMLYVQDRDIWVWYYKPLSEYFTNAIVNLPCNIESWDKICSSKVELDKILEQGYGVEKYKEFLVGMSLKHARWHCLGDGTEVCVVNSPLLASDIGEAVRAKKGWEEGDKGLIMVWFLNSEGTYLYQLRSAGGTDCSVLAKKHGGGGHIRAAGFTADFDPNSALLVL